MQIKRPAAKRPPVRLPRKQPVRQPYKPVGFVRQPRPMPRPMPGGFQPMPMPPFHGGFGGKTIDPAILDQIRGNLGTFSRAPQPMDPYITDQMGPGPGPDGGPIPGPMQPVQHDMSPFFQPRQIDPAMLEQLRQRMGGFQKPVQHDPFQTQFDPIELMGRARGLNPAPRWEGQLNQDALNRIFQRPPSRAMQFQAL